MISSRCPRPIGNHAVDGLQSGRHGLTHWLAVDHARSQSLQGNELVGGDGTLVINGLAERVHNATDHAVAHRHAHDASGPLNLVAFLDFGEFAEQHDADLIFFQVHRDASHAVREREKFAGHDLVESIHAGNTIAQGDNGSGLVHGDRGLVILDLLANQFRNFVCFYLCHRKALLSCQRPATSY